LAAENAATFAASGSPPGPGRRACKNASIWSSVLGHGLPDPAATFAVHDPDNYGRLPTASRGS